MPKSEDPKTLANANSDENSLGSLPDEDAKIPKKKSKLKSVTPATNELIKKNDTSLLDLVNNLDPSQANKEPKFNIIDAIILDSDNSSYTIVKEYLKKFKNPKESVERLYRVPFFLMNPEPSEWDFFGNTLYCHAALALFNKLYDKFPFIHTLYTTLSFFLACHLRIYSSSIF